MARRAGARRAEESRWFSGIASCARTLWLSHPKERRSTAAGRAAQVGREREEFDQARERGHRETVAGRRGALVSSEVRRERCGREPGPGCRGERPTPKLFRAVVFFLVIRAGARLAGGASELLPVRRLVTGAAIQGRFAKGLHQHERVDMHAGKVLA